MAATAPTTERPEGRRRRVPPAPPWRVGGASGAALEVLTDFERAAPQHEAAAFALWKALRDVHLWHTLPPERRARSFPGGRSLTRADLDAALADCPELASAWAAFARLLNDGVVVDAAELAAACHAVYAWTEQRSLLDTAAHFAEAAALLSPEDPGLANDAGWACRRAALHDRSEMWYDRGMVLAVKQDAQEDAVRVLQGLGTLRKDQGRIEAAREFYEEAVRRSVWTKKRRIGARAQHHLFALVAETGSLEEGLRQAEVALTMYPIYDRWFPVLAHDFAFLLVRHRYYSYARPLLEQLPAHIPDANIQALAYGNLALAAAGTGCWSQYREAAEKAVHFSNSRPDAAASVLLHAGQGAWYCGDFAGARAFADRAAVAAAARGDVLLQLEAAQLISELARNAQPPREPNPPDPSELLSVLQWYKVRLRRWLSPTRGTPE